MMNFNKIAFSRSALASALSAITLAVMGVGSFPRAAYAHETPCPYCKMKVTQDTATQDNETALRYGRKRIEYKCVWCAIADVNGGKYKDSDVTILAPSEIKSHPVEIKRTGGKWSAPAGAVFVGVKASHNICQDTYRAFTTKAAFDAYVAKQTAVKGAKPLTLDQLTATAK